MKVTVIGFDPGESAGVALLQGGALIHAFQGTPRDAITLLQLVLLRADHDDDVTVACERYVSATHGPRTHQPRAQQIVGAVSALVDQVNEQRTLNNCSTRVQLIMQGPAEASAIASRELLVKLGMWQTSHTVGRPDANDANMAIKHALTGLSKRHARLFSALLSSVDV